jgi:hypothetical protein
MPRKKQNAEPMARLEVSIPADLKRRLAEAEQGGNNLNLSAIAAQAYEDKLDRIEARKKKGEG